MCISDKIYTHYQNFDLKIAKESSRYILYYDIVQGKGLFLF